MPMSSAEKSRRYRQRLKDNPKAYEAHRKKDTERRRLARQKARELRIKQGFQKAKVAPRVMMLNNTGLSDRTNRLNSNNIHRLYELLESKRISDIRDLQIFRDIKRVIGYIESKDDWHLSTKINYVEALVKLPFIEKSFADVSKIYKSKVDKMYAKSMKIRGQNKKTQSEKDKWQDWTTIELAVSSPVLNDRDRAITALYTLVPPRRTGLIQHLKMVGLRDKKNEAFNYLVVDYRLNPRYILMRNYKTFKYYGEYKMELPSALQGLLKKHIKSSKKQKGDMVFNFHNDIINNAFKKALGNPITTNILRHSYITNFLSNNRSLNERRDLSNKMGHAVGTQLEYDRF